MARKGKQYVFSARTTEEGLKRLGEIRQERHMGWDELVIEAVCRQFGLDKAVMSLPKKEALVKAQEKKGAPTASPEKKPVEAKVEADNKPEKAAKPKQPKAAKTEQEANDKGKQKVD